MSKPPTMRGTLAFAAFLAVKDGMRRQPFLDLAKTFYDVLQQSDDRERMLEAIDPAVLKREGAAMTDDEIKAAKEFYRAMLAVVKAHQPSAQAFLVAIGSMLLFFAEITDMSFAEAVKLMEEHFTDDSVKH